MKVALAAMPALLLVVLGAATPTPTAETPAPTVSASPCEKSGQPTSLNEWIRRGDCLRDAKQLQAAVEAYRSGLAAFPAGSRDLYLSMGMTYGDLHEFDEELSTFKSALELDPADPESLYHMGTGYEDLGDYPTALDYFRKVIVVRPNDGRAHRNIGYVLLQQGQPEEAIGPLKTAIEIDPRDWKAHLNIAAAYAETYTAIFEELQEWVGTGPHTRDPNDTGLQHHNDLVKRFNAVDYRKEAQVHAREAARLNPDDPRTWISVGSKLTGEPNTRSEGVEALQRAVLVDPKDVDALQHLAYAQKEAHQYADAYETCKKLQKISPDDVWLLVTMADLEKRMDRFEDAERSYLTAIRLDDQDPDLHHSLACLYKQLRRDADARKELETAKQLRPDQAKFYEWSFSLP